jgi:Zn-dependent alcohol dehydrogenase
LPGGRRAATRVARASAAIRADQFVTKTIGLEQVTEALDELHAPKGIRTVVLL